MLTFKTICVERAPPPSERQADTIYLIGKQFENTKTALVPCPQSRQVKHIEIPISWDGDKDDEEWHINRNDGNNITLWPMIQPKGCHCRFWIRHSEVVWVAPDW